MILEKSMTSTSAKEIDKPCPICHAQPGEACQDLDDNDQPTGQRMSGALHAGRVFGPGPIVVRHTGRTNADGGAILEHVEPDSDGGPA